MAPKDRGPPPSPDGPGTRLWSECARSADSESPRNPWVSWGGEHPSTPLSNAHARSADPGSPRNRRFRGGGRPGVPAKSQISWGWETRGPHEIADFVGVGDPGSPRNRRFRGWEMARGKGPPRSGDATGRIRGPHEA